MVCNIKEVLILLQNPVLLYCVCYTTYHSWLMVSDLVLRVEVSIVISSYYSLYQFEEFMIVDALTLSLS